MSIRIHKERCIGCKKCIHICPGSLIECNDEGKAWMKYPKDCWGCASCIKACPVQAIDFYLGADIGGRGSTLTVRRKGPFMHWHIQHPNGSQREIVINTKEANTY